MLINQSLESGSTLGRYYPIAKELCKKNHSVTILALHHDFHNISKKEFELDTNLKLKYVGQMSVLKVNDTKYRLKGFKLYKNVLLSIINMTLDTVFSDADIIHIFKPQPVNSFAGLLGKALKNKPLYLDCDDFESESNKFSSSIQKRVFKIFEDNVPKYCRGITVNSCFLEERNIGLGYPKEKIVYVPNGIDRDRFSRINTTLIDSIKNKYDLHSKQIIMYFGGISLSSGHAVDLLIDAFQIVKKEISNTILVLIGGGEDIGSLKNYVNKKGMAESVIFIGRVKSEDIPNYIKIADVTVDPIRDTAVNKARSPLKIFESMAMGVPVITSDIGDRSDILQNGKSGLLVMAGNSNQLAEGIIYLLNDQNLRNKLIKNASKRINDFYWDKLINDFVKIYDL